MDVQHLSKRILLTVGLALWSLPVAADDLRLAQRLLDVYDAERYYTAVVEIQTRTLVRLYDGVLRQNAGVPLPAELGKAISDCYLREFGWRRFADGFAEILAGNLTDREMVLLIDFYSARAIPPMEIERFKQTIGKAPLIQQQVERFMDDNTSGCLQESAARVIGFARLAKQMPGQGQ